MITIATILWLISGIASFFVALKKLWSVIDEVFIIEYDILKYACVVGMFLFHLVGGVISLSISIYKHFRGD